VVGDYYGVVALFAQEMARQITKMVSSVDVEFLDFKGV
jgi:hypothetical protein